ncbi:MCE family protein [Actinomadura scrupuli]|uniref:MCE family protein n=1 Tax=Actinomadura scrupuli TaxID=559629 RepID=UPI003D96FFAE
MTSPTSPPRRSRPILGLGVVLVIAALVVGAVVVLWPDGKDRHLTAYFTSAVGLYPGADVRVLGIKVGQVTSVNPAGASVRIDMKYDADQKIPANAQAVIVSQTLVSDRYIQLTPVYRGGGVLADGTTLPVTRTVVPVEVDDVTGSLNGLNKALGPEGANSSGALSRLLQVGASNLSGQGEDIRGTIKDTATVLSTLSEDRKDITATVENLRKITAALAANDQQVRSFTDNLAGVSGQLAGEKDELGAALETLGPTLRNVTQFVKGNRTELAANVRQLAQVTAVLVKQKDALGEFLSTAPVGIANLAHAYDPISGTLGTRADLRQFKNPAMWICSLAYSLGSPPKQCEAMLAPLNKAAAGINLNLDLSWITALTTTYDPVLPPPDAYGPNGKGGKAKAGKGAKAGTTARTGGTDPNKTLGGLFPGGTR